MTFYDIHARHNIQSTLQTKSKRAWAETDLRPWLLKHQICDEKEVDFLMERFYSVGVWNVNTISRFSKEDLIKCGLNTVQAVAVINALKKV